MADLIIDDRQLRKMHRKLQQFSQSGVEQFNASCVKDLAARLLRKVKQRTPVGENNGGTLRRNWEVLEARKQGSDYIIEIVNSTEYASYVEYGHRTRNHTGWVEGRFMLTISEQEIEQDAPLILERKLIRKLEGMLDGG